MPSSRGGRRTKLSPRMVYLWQFFDQCNAFSPIVIWCRLLQHYLVVQFLWIGSPRLSYLRENQTSPIAESYTTQWNKLVDLGRGEDKMSSIGAGRLFIFPSTNMGSHLYMRHNLHDIIAISDRVENPGIFLTMAWRPHWSEIAIALLEHQKPRDSPDITARVFQMKSKLLFGSYLCKTCLVMRQCVFLSWNFKAMTASCSLAFTGMSNQKGCLDLLVVNDITYA